MERENVILGRQNASLQQINAAFEHEHELCQARIQSLKQQLIEASQVNQGLRQQSDQLGARFDVSILRPLVTPFVSFLKLQTCPESR